MKTQAKFRVPSAPVFGESESLTKLKGSKSSARAHEHRESERRKPSYKHEN